MSPTKLDKHKVHNCLTRLRSILECIEKEGKAFVTVKVSSDIDEAIETIKAEFSKVTGEEYNETIN